MEQYNFSNSNIDLASETVGKFLIKVGVERREALRTKLMLNQRDLEEGHHFEDAVAFGGWTMDDHSPKGFKQPGYSSRHIQTQIPYEIPFRSFYSLAVPKLMFAGRNISATHMAMSSTRVMATCALVGQAVGTGAALALEKGCLPAQITENYISLLQKNLQNDGCYIPGLLRSIREDVFPELAEEDVAILRNGWERPHEGVANTVSFRDGSCLTVELTAPGGALRLALDPDFSRESITSDPVYRKFAMRSHLMKTDKPLNMPANLFRSCEVNVYTSAGEKITTYITGNRKPRLFITLPENAIRVELAQMCSWGGSTVNLFACDII